jgi:hypothetical protein
LTRLRKGEQKSKGYGDNFDNQTKFLLIQFSMVGGTKVLLHNRVLNRKSEFVYTDHKDIPHSKKAKQAKQKQKQKNKKTKNKKKTQTNK